MLLFFCFLKHQIIHPFKAGFRHEWPSHSKAASQGCYRSLQQDNKMNNSSQMQYTMYPSTVRGSSLAVNDRTMDVRVTSDRPSTT